MVRKQTRGYAELVAFHRVAVRDDPAPEIFRASGLVRERRSQQAPRAGLGDGNGEPLLPERRPDVSHEPPQGRMPTRRVVAHPEDVSESQQVVEAAEEGERNRD